jgi:isoamylase
VSGTRLSGYTLEKGTTHPIGATPDAQGVNFSVFSQNSTGIELLLFDRHDDRVPSQVFKLDPHVHRSFYLWHCYVRGLKAGAHYAYRVHGPWDWHRGHRFNAQKVLIDPYAEANTNTLWNRVKACGPDDNLASSMRSVVVDLRAYDWEGDRPLRRPSNETIIYEIHVRGFTRSPTSGVAQPGTFRGVVDRIPYLADLGITAVELMPVMEFDDKEILRTLADGRPLRNFWGYSTIGFFAPASQYCMCPELGAHVNEFRDMVKALHKAGIEVLLDVVFTHTDEGNHLGPTISFKGLDNSVYYHLVRDAREYYMDYSGCGNALNCNHPLVTRFIVDCLRFWVREMHVDGFRFDEGSILSRMEDGSPSARAPLPWSIELLETLQDTKLIAEAWDAAGLYQIGSFPGLRWADWNGRFRDDVRRFVRGDRGLVGQVATRIAGSADLYECRGHLPINSINFVTCHDGFTMNDLVSYDGKHNEANGEDNRDGIENNLSANYGTEGPSDDAGLDAFRSRQAKNFATILLLSQGVPMILGGDEMRRSQLGNNNAYCQDNELSWFDWRLAEKHHDVVRFFRLLIDFRKRHPSLQREQFFNGEKNERDLPDLSWHGCQLNSPGWNNPASGVLAFTLGGLNGDDDIHVILNMEEKALDFELPPLVRRSWHRVADTARAYPEDIVEPGRELPVSGPSYRAEARSTVVLVSLLPINSGVPPRHPPRGGTGAGTDGTTA